MKTFEERYTAWIDGELEGNALVAFEQELERRAAVGEAYADKAEAMRLNAFLHDHLQAPVLTNGDFFNHQLRERITGERTAARGSALEARPTVQAPLFAWSLSRLAWLGAACLFVSVALYYGMIPKQTSNGLGTPSVAFNKAGTVEPQSSRVPDLTARNNASAPSPANLDPRAQGKEPQQLALLSKEEQERQQREWDRTALEEKLQRERATIEPGSDIQARVPDQTVPTTATPLHYKDSNVNVLWVNGLDYLPDTSALDDPASSPSPGKPAPAATATP